MALTGFQNNYSVEDRVLNVVICVNQAVGYYHKSPINFMLEMVQEQLKRELEYFEAIYVAYVYETPMLDVLDFSKLTNDTPTYYIEPYENGAAHSLKHILLMGLALLEEQQKYNSGENRLYLLNDERLNRITENEIFVQEGARLMVNKRFSSLQFKPILFTNQKNEGRENAILAQFFKTNGGDIRNYNTI